MPRDRQVAALPIRHAAGGTLQVLLVTSRETKRWVIPKGWPWPDLEDHLAAAEEAREEAGVEGVASAVVLGTYVYDKRLRKGARSVSVTVFLLEVTRELKRWPERPERERCWVSPADAAEMVEEPELRDLLRALAAKPPKAPQQRRTNGRARSR